MSNYIFSVCPKGTKTGCELSDREYIEPDASEEAQEINEILAEYLNEEGIEYMWSFYGDTLYDMDDEDLKRASLEYLGEISY